MFVHKPNNVLHVAIAVKTGVARAERRGLLLLLHRWLSLLQRCHVLFVARRKAKVVVAVHGGDRRGGRCEGGLRGHRGLKQALVAMTTMKALVAMEALVTVAGMEARLAGAEQVGHVAAAVAMAQVAMATWISELCG